MSKSDTHVSNIDTSSARRTLNEPTFTEGKSIVGLDSETADGDIFAIGAYDEATEVYKDNCGQPLDGDTILQFLTANRLRDSINVWYNLNFDAGSVLKMLPREKVEEIKFTNSANVEVDGTEYDITYIPKKVLKISVHGNTYSHYDASQFTYAPTLEDSYEKWVGESDAKADENVDVTKFGKDGDSLNEYTESNLDEIAHYLKQDCKMTAEVFRQIVDTAEALDIPMGKPYSTGFISADYMKGALDYKPGYAQAKVQENAFECFKGGRFEVIRRGNVGTVKGADINSAYPARMANLPDPSTLQWASYGSDCAKDIDDAPALSEVDYGFVKARVWTDESRPVQPFGTKDNNPDGRVEYPAFKGETVWTIKDILEYGVESGIVTDYELMEASLAIEPETAEYPLNFFEELYAERKTMEENGNQESADMLKTVINSMYGKTAQTNINRVRHQDLHKYADDVEEGQKRVYSEDLPDEMKRHTDADGQPYYEWQSASSFFNPFLASYTTGLTRLQLLKGVVENDLEDDVVMLATDCLMFDADAFEGTDLHEETEKDYDSYEEALGGWDYDYEGQGYVIGSGIYQVDTADGKTKQGLRGFKDFNGDDGYETLREASEMYPEGIEIENSRPVTYGDVLSSGGSLGDVGQFTDTMRKLTADMDSKRNWNESPDFNDLLDGSEYGEPKIHGDDN